MAEDIGAAMDHLASENETRKTPKKKRPRVRIIVTYALAGPPIGGIVALLAIYMYYAITSGLEVWLDNLRAEPLQTILSMPIMLVGFTYFGYIFGGVQAILTGVFISLNSGKDGKFGYSLAVIAPMLVALAIGVVLMGSYQIRFDFIFWEAPLFLGVIGVAASVIVRFLFRKRFSPKFAKA